MLKVTIEQFSDLSAVEQANASDNGSGKEFASYLRVKSNDETVLLESDAMEPEDATFGRDLNWIVTAIHAAYNRGRRENH